MVNVRSLIGQFEQISTSFKRSNSRRLISTNSISSLENTVESKEIENIKSISDKIKKISASIKSKSTFSENEFVKTLVELTTLLIELVNIDDDNEHIKLQKQLCFKETQECKDIISSHPMIHKLDDLTINTPTTKLGKDLDNDKSVEDFNTESDSDSSESESEDVSPPRRIICCLKRSSIRNDEEQGSDLSSSDSEEANSISKFQEEGEKECNKLQGSEGVYLSGNESNLYELDDIPEDWKEEVPEISEESKKKETIEGNSKPIKPKRVEYINMLESNDNDISKNTITEEEYEIPREMLICSLPKDAMPPILEHPAEDEVQKENYYENKEPSEYANILDNEELANEIDKYSKFEEIDDETITEVVKDCLKLFGDDFIPEELCDLTKSYPNTENPKHLEHYSKVEPSLADDTSACNSPKAERDDTHPILEAETEEGSNIYESNQNERSEYVNILDNQEDNTFNPLLWRCNYPIRVKSEETKLNDDDDGRLGHVKILNDEISEGSIVLLSNDEEDIYQSAPTSPLDLENEKPVYDKPLICNEENSELLDRQISRGSEINNDSSETATSLSRSSTSSEGPSSQETVIDTNEMHKYLDEISNDIKTYRNEVNNSQEYIRVLQEIALSLEQLKAINTFNGDNLESNKIKCEEELLNLKEEIQHNQDFLRLCGEVENLDNIEHSIKIDFLEEVIEKMEQTEVSEILKENRLEAITRVKECLNSILANSFNEMYEANSDEQEDDCHLFDATAEMDDIWNSIASMKKSVETVEGEEQRVKLDAKIIELLRDVDQAETFGDSVLKTKRDQGISELYNIQRKLREINDQK